MATSAPPAAVMTAIVPNLRLNLSSAEAMLRNELTHEDLNSLESEAPVDLQVRALMV